MLPVIDACCTFNFLSTTLSHFWYPFGSQVVTYKNHALDNFLKDLDKVSSPDEKIVRVGRLADDTDLRMTKILLREVCL